MKKSRDRVEREIVIQGSIERAYAALTDPALFPTWGPVRVEGALVPGERPVLDFGPSGGGRVAVYVVAAEPPRYFAYRWKQGETDPEALLGDPLAGPNTLVEFHLDEIEAGTRVRVVESGIADLPSMAGVADPDQALEQMGKGWELMLGGLPRALAGGEPADRLEEQLELPAARDRVFDALVHPERWWYATVEGAFAAGEAPVVDFGQFGRYRFAILAIDPPHHLAYRANLWAEDPEVCLADPRTAPSTLVEIRLVEAGAATRVELVESGFDALPGAPRAARYRRARQGWGVSLGMLAQHLAGS